MKSLVSLDSPFQQYAGGELGKRELEEIIIDFIISNPRQFFLMDFPQDERIDFIAWVYPRIAKAIDRYQNSGASFSGYLTTLLRYSAREYQRHECEHRLVEQIYWEAASEELAVHSRETPYPDDDEPKPPIKEFIENPRQVLILILKSYNFVSDEFIFRAAPAIGLSGKTLLGMVNELRQMRLRQDGVIRAFRDRIYCQYFRCKSFEYQIIASTEGSTRRRILQDKLKRAKKRLENMKKYFKSIKTGASNREIAKLLKVPKGTVDSNLFAVKTRGKEIPPGKRDQGRGRPRRDSKINGANGAI